MPKDEKLIQIKQEGKEGAKNEKDNCTPNSNPNPGAPGNGQKDQGKKRKSGKPRRGKSSYNPGRKRGNEIEFNHPQWFMPNEAIGEQIASLPFNVPAGAPLHLKGISATNAASEVQVASESKCDSRLQSVMAINYFSTPGISNSAISGINMAASKIYADIRSKNSGAKVYEAADVMMYILIMQDIYANLCSAFRIVGACDNYMYLDKNVPDTIGSALRVDFSDVRANKATYLAKINTLIEKVNSFAVPANLKVFQRSSFINTNIFKDSESNLGQYYVFYKYNYLRWSGKTNEKGTELINHTYTLENTLQAYLNIIENQLNDLFLDSDVLTISADILKAFDNINLYKFKPLAIDFKVQPTYDDHILMQIHNMKWINVDLLEVQEDQFSIRQEAQLIKFEPSFDVFATAEDGLTHPFYLVDSVLDSHSDNPDYKDVLEATRLNFTCELTADSKRVKITSCGSELPLSVSLHYRAASGAALVEENVPMLVIRFTGNNVSHLVGTTDAMFTRLNKLSQFRNGPLRYQVISVGTSDNQYAMWSGFDLIGDTQFTTNLPGSVVKNINDIVMYAMYVLE